MRSSPEPQVIKEEVEAMEVRKRELKIGRSQDRVDVAFMHEEFNGLNAMCLQIFFY